MYGSVTMGKENASVFVFCVFYNMCRLQTTASLSGLFLAFLATRSGFFLVKAGWQPC